ncbi:MAG TPA: SRPBCC family protein [Pyrinomonadaceae bacterium]|mgnify:FL=1|nr:SRPBCC family protein [Acidobacteriota bacterium]HQZ95744.1 SRPBCC family protein [Pyrinomonadaceae bacterium]
MPQIVLETFINASPETCFDLIRDDRIHIETTAKTKESAFDGGTNTKIGLGQTVTFEGTHFGFRQQLTMKVVKFERPVLFVDEMTDGTFSSFRHIHEFTRHEAVTLMLDTLTWTSPYGMLGRIVDKFLIKRHLRNLVSRRNARLKQIAEAENIST